jgi:ATP-dependent Lon protease
MPDVLPVLPVRETVVFPLTIAPVSIEGNRTRRLVEDVTSGDRLVALVTRRHSDARPPRPEDLYAHGSAAILHEALRGPDDLVRVAVQGLERVRIVGWVRTEPYFVARVQWVPDVIEHGPELDAMVRTARHLFLRFVTLVTELSSDLAATVDRVQDPRQLAYLLASTTPMTTEARQQVLEHPSVMGKLRRMIEHLQHDIAVRELMQRIAGEVRTEPSPESREASLKREIENLQRELGGRETEQPEGKDLRGTLAELPLPEEARKEVDREVERLERTPTSSPEHGMIRTYLEWVAKLPWAKTTGRPIDVGRAREVLDADHYDLRAIKDRIVEYLAVRRLRADRGVEGVGAEADGREPILCFVGPPGVGKTSLGQSIARALGRKFARVALGGIHDEAEIRGHRRTYIGAMPGRVLQALARCGASDPVFILDEVDKLGVGYHGDPSAALLEVLDPAQNSSFVDNYMGVPFDLSRVLFVCTANNVDTIPPALLDRMELLFLAGYTDAEKLFIARRHLLPKAIAAHALRPGEVVVDDAAIRCIVRGYTREAGVRSLGRELAGVMRKVALRVGQRECEDRTTEDGWDPIVVGEAAVAEYLGTPRFHDESMERIDRPGVAMGLAWMPTGGDILFVEASIMPCHGDALVLTGQLGNVMRESAQAALSYLRTNAGRLGIDARSLEHKTVHVHVPAGAIPKDGPSAGVTMLVALASQASGRIVRSEIGMTGEVTLRGRVLPVGGVKEKVLAAHRAGLRVVVLPRRCEPQLEDVPAEVRSAIQFVFVDSADEVLATVLGLGDGVTGERVTQPMIELPPTSVH